MKEKGNQRKDERKKYIIKEVPKTDTNEKKENDLNEEIITKTETIQPYLSKLRRIYYKVMDN